MHFVASVGAGSGVGSGGLRGFWPAAVVVTVAVVALRLGSAGALGPLADVLLGLVLSGLLFAAARYFTGVSLLEVGLSSRRTLEGFGWGFAAAALVFSAGLYVSLLLQSVGPNVEVPVAESQLPWWWSALVVVPLGTVMLEELLFRGVLWAWLARVVSGARVLLLSSVVFALWHVPPLLIAGTDVVSVFVTVLVTFVAGLGFGALRAVSGSLWAPVLGHMSTNILGVLLLPFLS